MKKSIIILLTISIALPAIASEKIIFTGMPEINKTETGGITTPKQMTDKEAFKYRCVITRHNAKYFWTTRENLELKPVYSGIFITFISVDAAGYIRIVNPNIKDKSSLNEIIGPYDFMEHIILGLTTITYFGKSILSQIDL